MLTWIYGVATFVFFMLAVIVSPVILVENHETASIIMSSLCIAAFAASYVLWMRSVRV